MKDPLVSIVVPTYNEEQYLRELHAALKSQDFENYEILYIDDGSTDGTWSILEDFSREDNVSCCRLERNYPVGYVRAYGVVKAQGDYIASMDADCIPEANWLSMVKHLDGETAVIGFPVIPPSDLDYLAHRFQYTGDGRPNPTLMLHGAGVIMRKDVVLAAGNYPSRRVGEDTALFRKILSMGKKLKYSEQTQIRHQHKQQTFVDFLRRFYRTGRNNTSTRTFSLFGLGFPALILLSVGLIHFLGTPGLISLILPIGFLINPIRVASYAKDFAKPESKAMRLLLFAAMRIPISLAFIAGLWKGIISSGVSKDQVRN